METEANFWSPTLFFVKDLLSHMKCMGYILSNVFNFIEAFLFNSVRRPTLVVWYMWGRKSGMSGAMANVPNLDGWVVKRRLAARLPVRLIFAANCALFMPSFSCLRGYGWFGCLASRDVYIEGDIRKSRMVSWSTSMSGEVFLPSLEYERS